MCDAHLASPTLELRYFCLSTRTVQVVQLIVALAWLGQLGEGKCIVALEVEGAFPFHDKYTKRLQLQEARQTPPP